jgi:hypothetical protein
VLHPESLERAAAAIAAAQAELEAVDARLRAEDRELDGIDAVGPIRQAVEVVAAGTGLGLLLAAINIIPPFVVAIGPIGGLLWAVLVLARSRGDVSDYDLASVEDDAERRVAVRRLESARAAWVSLAGPNIAPDDLDTALRHLDAQSRVTEASLVTSPTVRAVNAVHRRALARWRVAWASLGVDPPPPPDEFERAVVDLRDRLDLRDSAPDRAAQLRIS